VSFLDNLPKGLVDNLTPGEDVACCVGNFAIAKPTYVAVTNKRVIYYDSKFLGRYDMKTIPYSKIYQVYGKKGKMRGHLYIEGEEEEQDIVVDALKNEDVFLVIETMKNEINKIAIEPISINRKKKLMSEEWYFSKPPENVVRTFIGAAPHAMQSMDAPKSGVEQIRELKGLLDEGLISEEEFQAKREEILKRI